MAVLASSEEASDRTPPKAVSAAGFTRVAGYALRRKLGLLSGARTLRVRGDYGAIDGPIADRTVLPTYARTRCWSPVKNCLLKKFFAGRGGTYIDIGANIGLTTIPVAQNPQVRCIAFEPAPDNFRCLARNVARNCPHRNVEVRPVALLDRGGTEAFELSDSNMGDHRVRRRAGNGAFGEGRRAAVEVAAQRLDDALGAGDLQGPLAVKLIAQGAESAIIAGGARTLKEAGLMILQFYPYELRRLDSDPAELCRFVAHHFDEGIAMRGETEPAPEWQPIAAITDTAAQLATDPACSPYDYFYFVLRNTARAAPYPPDGR